MTKQQQKLLLIIPVIIISSYVVKSIVATALQVMFYQPPRPRPKAPLKTPPKALAPVAKAVVPQPSPPPVKTAPPDPWFRFLGLWHGQGALDGRGICDLHFEIRKGPEPGVFLGFSSFSCASSQALMGREGGDPRNALMNRMNPNAAILTGTVKDGAFHFKADKDIGADVHGCTVTSFTLTPFGAYKLAAEWEAGKCQGGNMLLWR
jgi:hypothetical protein